ncbi:MAG: hypothetical protein ACRDD7_18245 [Peptostreptococcaceae bacterium]
MFKILAVFFIVLGIILTSSYKYSLKNSKNLNKNKRDELEKTKQNGSTFVFAGISVLFLDIALRFFK